MRTIVVSQKVVVNEFCERYDLLDQKWISFLTSMDFWPIILPNNLEFVKKFISTNELDGVLLTGGNSLTRYGGNAPERDETEYFLLEWALKREVPLLGVCRGMQVIQDYFSNKLFSLKGHVNVRHKLSIEKGYKLSDILDKYDDVNSFHNYGTKEANGELVKVASSMDQVVMAVEHVDKMIFGIMWHPEREKIINVNDKLLFNFIFGGLK